MKTTETKKPTVLQPEYKTLGELSEWFFDGTNEEECIVDLGRDTFKFQTGRERKLFGAAIGWLESQVSQDGMSRYLVAWLDAQGDDQLNREIATKDKSAIWAKLSDAQKQTAVAITKRIDSFVKAGIEKELVRRANRKEQ